MWFLIDLNVDVECWRSPAKCCPHVEMLMSEIGPKCCAHVESRTCSFVVEHARVQRLVSAREYCEDFSYGRCPSQIERAY